MITKIYYTVEEKVFNSPDGLGVWGWKTDHESKKITDLDEAKKMVVAKKSRMKGYIAEWLERETDQATIDHIKAIEDNNECRIVEVVKTFTHVSEYCYTDVRAYEIVKVVSDQTIEIRAMEVKHDISHLTQHVGGFSAHTENQHNQKVTYASKSNNPVIRIRRKTNNPNAWTGNGSRFGLTETPYAFYDYNF